MDFIDIDAEIEALKRDAAQNPYYARDEQEAIAHFQPIFAPENVEGLSAEDFKSFLLRGNNKHWWGIHRHSRHLTADMDHLRDALRILLDDTEPIERRLDILFPKNKSNYIKGLGPATATPILLVSYPDKYSVYNRKVEVALKACGLHPDDRGLSFAQLYVKVNEPLGELSQRHHISRWLLDWVFHRITGQIEEGERGLSHWTAALCPPL